MYSARISRKSPALFVVLIDQSGSMEEPTSLYGRTVSKAEAVAATVNMLLGELLHRSRREEGYRDYFDIAVLGYHGERVEPLLSKGKRLVVKPSELYERDTPRRQVQRERRLPDGRTLFSVVEQREWIAPFAEGQTPSCCMRTNWSGTGVRCGITANVTRLRFSISPTAKRRTATRKGCPNSPRAFAGRVPTTAMHC